MTTQDPQTVSIDAHTRVSKERDDLKAQLAEAKDALRMAGFRDAAREYFEGKKAEDVGGLTSLALPHLQPLESLDDVAATLDRVIPASMYQATAPPAAETPPATPEPQEPVAPRPAIAGPDPAAPGAPVAPKKIKINSEEMRQRIQTQGWGAIAAAAASGELEASPINDHAQALINQQRPG